MTYHRPNPTSKEVQYFRNLPVGTILCNEIATTVAIKISTTLWRLTGRSRAFGNSDLVKFFPPGVWREVK